MVEGPISDSKDLRKKALRGAGWSFAAKFVRQVIQFCFQILLARLLAPADFGLLGMIVLFSTLADLIKNLGLGAAIIQRKDISPSHLDTVFWSTFLLAICLFVLLQLAAPWIAAFYKIPQLENITRVYSLVFLVGSLNVVQEALMYKELQFKRLFWIETSAVLISGVLALVMAYNNFGVWTLVAQYISIAVNQYSRALGNLFLAPYLPF